MFEVEDKVLLVDKFSTKENDYLHANNSFAIEIAYGIIVTISNDSYLNVCCDWYDENDNFLFDWWVNEDAISIGANIGKHRANRKMLKLMASIKRVEKRHLLKKKQKQTVTIIDDFPF